jgi:hypothetical protein
MSQEDEMSTLSDQVHDQISAGRKTLDRSVEDLKDLDVPPAAFVAAGLVAGLVAFGIVGWMVYRARRRRPIVKRLQDALPDSVRDLPQGVRAQVKRVL